MGGPNVITWVLIRGMQGESERTGDVMMESELEVMCFEDRGRVREYRRTGS